jgi:hypothetical protein
MIIASTKADETNTHAVSAALIAAAPAADGLSCAQAVSTTIHGIPHRPAAAMSPLFRMILSRSFLASGLPAGHAGGSFRTRTTFD